MAGLVGLAGLVVSVGLAGLGWLVAPGWLGALGGLGALVAGRPVGVGADARSGVVLLGERGDVSGMKPSFSTAIRRHLTEPHRRNALGRQPGAEATGGECNVRQTEMNQNNR